MNGAPGSVTGPSGTAPPGLIPATAPHVASAIVQPFSRYATSTCGEMPDSAAARAPLCPATDPVSAADPPAPVTCSPATSIAPLAEPFCNSRLSAIPGALRFCNDTDPPPAGSPSATDPVPPLSEPSAVVPVCTSRADPLAAATVNEAASVVICPPCNVSSPGADSVTVPAESGPTTVNGVESASPSTLKAAPPVAPAATASTATRPLVAAASVTVNAPSESTAAVPLLPNCARPTAVPDSVPTCSVPPVCPMPPPELPVRLTGLLTSPANSIPPPASSVNRGARPVPATINPPPVRNENWSATVNDPSVAIALSPSSAALCALTRPAFPP